MRHPPIPGPIACQTLQTPSGVSIYHTGPKLSADPLPAFFYFALAGDESLCLDPFNQVIAFLSDAPIHCFSLTLPGHGPGFDKTKAIQYYADELRKGNNHFKGFFRDAIDTVSYVIGEGYVDPNRMAAGGLSRGGFAATWLAALDERFENLIAFAPLTDLAYHKDFAAMADNPIMKELDLLQTIPQLVHKRVRYYMGNRDLRVGTDVCFNFLQKLVEASFEAQVRSPQIEMVMSPSIGHMGHGTAPHVFYSGAEWLRQILLG